MADRDRTHDGSSTRRPRKAGAFDIRIFIAALLGLYGVILVLTGILATSQEDLDRAGGSNVNLWTGVALLVGAALFVAWARWRPVVVPPDHDHEHEDSGQAG